MSIIDFSSLEIALTQLKKSHAFLKSSSSDNDRDMYEQFRAATIQAFEFTYERAWKLIRRQLGDIVANPEEIPAMDFRDLMRAAADAGIIRHSAKFMIYREMRNITSHRYEETSAEAVISVVDDFIKDMDYLLDQLRRRNAESD